MQEVTAGISRRTLLKTGLLGTLLVAAGSVALTLQKPKQRAGAPKLTVLDADEYAILAAISDRVCPPLGEGAPGATALGVAAGIDTLLAGSESDVQQGTKMALRIFDNALTGALSGERLAPFTKLEADEQDRVLERWRTSDVGFRRTVYRGITNAIFAVYWGDPRTWARIGYEGPPDMQKLRSAYADELVDLDALRATPLAKGA